LESSYRYGDKSLVNKILNERLINRFYGFELMLAPYVVAHLKITEFLKEEGYELWDGKRLSIYLTNTLSNNEPKPFAFMPHLTMEGREANRIKNEDVLVVVGNPPYSIHSMNINDWIQGLIKDYKPSDETKLNIDDDYIKFIRFAHWKMVKVDKGIIGIITNNSFLNGLIHRKMRGQLLQDFDKIYILNLHGSSRLQEKSPDGTLDQNVFDIMQGVSISILVKENNKNNKNCKLYYKDIWGRKEAKSMILNDNTIHTMDFVELDYEGFNKSFRNTLWGKTRFIDNLNFFEYKTINGRMEKYGNSWGINQIFEEFGSGVSTRRDNICVHFSKNSVVVVINVCR
jgi:predicted helicase